MLWDAPELRLVADNAVRLIFACDHAALLLHDDAGFGVEQGFQLIGLGLFDQYMITMDEIGKLGVMFRVLHCLSSSAC